MSDLRERIALAIEAELIRIDSRLDDPNFDEKTRTYMTGYRNGLSEAESIARDVIREAARIARDTPAAHDEPATPARTSDAYRTLAARLWAERHGVSDIDVAFAVVDGMAGRTAGNPGEPAG